MKAITKRFLAVFLSLMIVIAPSIQQANAASSWSITKAVSAGARTVVTATSGGYKSAINLMPTAGRLALKMVRVGNTAYLLYLAAELANDGIDFVMSPDNNSIKYKVPQKGMLVNEYFSVTVSESNVAQGCAAIAAAATARGLGAQKADTWFKFSGGWQCVNKKTNGELDRWNLDETDGFLDKSMPVTAVTAEIIKRANNGDATAQSHTRETAVEMVVSGDWDADLLQGAVPTSDTRPLIPAVPGNGNGNVTHGSDVGTGEDGMSGATPGQQGDAAKDAADAAKKAAQAAADAAKAAAEDARKAADDAQDLINSGADAAEKAAAEAKAAAAAQAAAEAKAAADRAAQSSAERAAAAERAAQAATAAAQAAAAQAAKDLAAAIAAGDAAAKAAAEAATAAAAKELAEAKAKQEAAEKAAEKAKAEAAKPFELPAFCTWAAIVCETAEWLKREPETPEITAIDTDSPIDDFDSDKSYITFTGSCPPKYTASLSIMGATAPFEFDYTPICTVMSYLKPFIVGAGYIAAAYIIAGHSRGSKD